MGAFTNIIQLYYTSHPDLEQQFIDHSGIELFRAGNKHLTGCTAAGFPATASTVQSYYSFQFIDQS